MTCLVKRFHPQVKGQEIYLLIEQIDGPLSSLKGTALVKYEVVAPGFNGWEIATHLKSC